MSAGLIKTPGLPFKIPGGNRSEQFYLFSDETQAGSAGTQPAQG